MIKCYTLHRGRAERDGLGDGALILLFWSDPEPLSHKEHGCHVQALQCRVLHPVKYAQLSATYKYCELACASTICMQIFVQVDTCVVGITTHMHTTTWKWSLKGSLTPSCSQALKIGLTGITLNTLPIQLDYTTDSAFIHLCCAHTQTHRLNAHTCTYSVPISILSCEFAHIFFVAQSALCAALLPANGLFQPRL